MSEIKNQKQRVDEIDRYIGNRLRLRRIMIGLTQEKLAEAFGVTAQQVQKYEKAINRISSGKLYSFSKILKVPIDYFFEKNEEDNIVLQQHVAEEGEEYYCEPQANDISNKEVVSLVKAFGAVQSPKIRKQLLEFVKLMSLIPKA